MVHLLPQKPLKELCKKNLRPILWNYHQLDSFYEIPFNIVKRCNNQSLRRWYTLINIFKTTSYALYYRRPLFDRNGTVIIKTFNHHLRAAKRVATERKSDILEKILFLPEKDDSVTPFYKILNEIHHDTALYRRKDNKDFCYLSDYRKRLSRTQNFHRKQNIPKISKEKKQLLIENAFKRTYRVSQKKHSYKIFGLEIMLFTCSQT